MADIINMVWNLPEIPIQPGTSRGIGRLEARRDCLSDSGGRRSGQEGRQKEEQSAPEDGDTDQDAELALLFEEAQALLMQIPLENPHELHELGANGGVLLKGSY